MKFLLLIAISLISFQTMARTCYVDLVDTWTNYRYESFAGNKINGPCRDALRACNKMKQERDLESAKCLERQLRERQSSTARINSPRNRFAYLLKLTDRQLASRAMNERVGSCLVVTGGYFDSCRYYVNVNGLGYPYERGCSDRSRTTRENCNQYNPFDNAGCLIRRAIEENRCR